MYRPLLSNRITQRFGDNKACITGAGKVIGVAGTCPANTWPFYPSIGMKGHNGIDYGAFRGEQVFHAGTYDGWMMTERDPNGGIGVNVVSNEPVKLRDGREVYVKTRYWHLKTSIGHDRKQVRLGEIIGLADNTGASSGDHLHFGIKVCDKNGVSLEPNNEYNGAFDPTPYIDNTTDAKSAAEYLYRKVPKLSEKERSEMLSQLSLTRQLLIAYQELLRKL